ncbi:arsenate reductase-like glutaredoxin family protein [Elusimicrobium simillimum]|uniref:D-Ala-D-Ala carboxypeptidase family metallohydrolase n=1 Tax=Elusimicrobium simillimum TaxID=3143438 RepID=UPI003C6F43E6
MDTIYPAKLAENFTFDELAFTSLARFRKTNLDFAMENLGKLKLLAAFAQKVRSILNTPMIVTSAARCPGLNAALNGAGTSQHLKCEAIDFIPQNMTLEEGFKIIRQSNLRFGQLIHERVKGKEWLHISMGHPFREHAKCGQSFVWDNGKTLDFYQNIEE